MGWTLIQHTALTSSAASVTLGSGGTIPQTYKTLKLVVSLRSTNNNGANDNTLISFNGGAVSGTWRELYGTGTAAGSGNGSNNRIAYNVAANGSTANTFGSGDIVLSNYTSTTQNKPFLADGVSESNIAGVFMAMTANLWSNTNAITSITLTPATAIPTSDFVSGSTFTLYGLS